MNGRFALDHWPIARRWAGMITLALAAVILFELLQFPAALLLGPMASAILFATRGGAVRVPQPAFRGAQVFIGLMMASSIPLDLVAELRTEWPVFVSGILFSVVAAGILGYFMTRARLFPGTTAIWGSSPGAAAAMVLMSEAYGADMRLVAFMQYLRVACCAVVATVLARTMGLDASAPAHEFFPPLPVGPAALTVAVAVGVFLLAQRVRIAGGPLVLALMVGIGMKALGLPLVLPPALLAVCYAILGFGIGLRFTPEVVRHAARAFPRTLASILTLIAACAAFGYLLHLVAGVDLLTALLATSPGGADTVAIIAASPGMNVDVPFVMTMQVGRFLFVVLTAPTLARYLSRGATPGA
ncbi:AbrB family transcriptional regulator [Falsirhodobacter sp. 20TX0035]|uniref:AbrB family transcriptional regulator n=1 Tax=Falsirhodobacter sp. 20TX0035 TaxID=3022019 RepID=UPI00232C7E95|nr:AbrB family transcriptional regulator [Falsirhodobacter sp. 20TX0035]MDB6453603.1 AbrB family transcriptional regulator [Falsirhodobacter sp. 20TX0035]